MHNQTDIKTRLRHFATALSQLKHWYSSALVLLVMALYSVNAQSQDTTSVLAGLPKAVIVSLAELSFDDKYAVQQSCAPSRTSDRQTSLQGYVDCINREISTLQSLPAPDLSGLSDNERYALQQSCFAAQSTLGAATYRQCVNAELAALQQYAPVSMVGLTSIEKNAIQLGCSPTSVRQTAAQYRLCVAEALAAVLKARRNTLETAEVTDIAGTNAPVRSEPVQALITTASIVEGNPTAQELAKTVDNDAATTPRMISRPQAPSVHLSTLATPITEPITSSPDTADRQPVTDIPVKPVRQVKMEASEIERLQQPNPAIASTDKGFGVFARLSKFDWSQFWQTAVYALPVLLLILAWRLIAAGIRSRSQHRHFAFNEGGAEVNFTQSDLDQLDQILQRSGTTNRSTHPDTSSPGKQHPAAAPVQPSAVFRRSDSSALALWLRDQPPPQCKRYCTEFLLYWVSYGDGNYDPAKKNYLLRTHDKLTDHDLIKKWVLQQDVNAYVDALSYLRIHFSNKAMEQTLNLMFAVLVKQELTPVQNTFFRFFADLSGIGSAGLSRIYSQCYDKPLPPMPRPDDIRWWEQQAASPSDNTRAVNTPEKPTERDSMLMRLGVDKGATEEDIDSAYRKIANRYHPKQFTELGEKEQELARRHLQRYSEAYHFLTGVSA